MVTYLKRFNIVTFPSHTNLKTTSALYEIEYQLDYIYRKINFEKLRISNDQGGGGGGDVL